MDMTRGPVPAAHDRPKARRRPLPDRPRYDVLLCDVWGVIHKGRESFPAACAALARYALRWGQSS